MFGQTYIFFRIFTELLLKSTLVLFLALLITTLMRKKSASLRHFVLVVFLISLLFIPLLTFVHFGWQTNLLPSQIGSEKINPERSPKKLTDSKSLEAGINVTSVEVQNSRKTRESSGFESGKQLIVSSKPSLPAGQALNVFLILIWAGGVFLLLLGICRGLITASRMTREGKPVNDPVWRKLMNRFLAFAGLNQEVRIKSHKNVFVPLTWGLFKPVILIPSNHKSWSEDQKKSALFHELSHIKRADFLVTILVRISLALFWFHPLSWLVFRTMKNEQEKACDEMVLQTGIKPSTYAANLLFFRNGAGHGWAPSLTFLSILEGSSFGHRLTTILKQKLTIKEIAMKTKLFIGFAVILAIAVIGTARPSKVSPKVISGDALFERTDNSPALCSPENQQYGKSKETTEARENIQAEQKQEEKKSKEEEKHAIIISDKNGKDIPIEITIIKDKDGKKYCVKNITLKKGLNEEIYIYDYEGKEIELDEGVPIRLVIKEGNLELIDGENIIITSKDGVLAWTAKDIKGKGDADILFLEKKGAKNLKISKANIKHWTIKKEEDAHGKNIAVISKGKNKKIGVGLNDDKNLYVVLGPGAGGHIFKNGKVVTFEKDEIQDIIKKIRGNLQKLDEEKAPIKEIMELLNELEKRIENKNAIAVFTSEKGKGDVLFSWAGGGIKNREVYERAVEKIKKLLPEGCTLESEFDEESGVLKLNLKNLDSQNFSKDLIHKIVKILKEEIK
ncbi:MAG: M56 family metallopeptidase [Candidatus Aminicenantes bacterium]|nr:M56 family metallopeptidase [Candidatus Aminicenantes bacterium]